VGVSGERKLPIGYKMAIDKAHVLGGTAIKPVERKGWEAIQYLIYNKDTGEVFTRTPKSWALIIIFYAIYYTCLAAFWAAMLTIFFTTIDENVPKWQSGIIGRSPGVGLRPKQPDNLIDSSMITFSVTKAKDDDKANILGYQGWIDRTNEFLEPYRNSQEFDLATLGGCQNAPYGYDQGKPCIFLKLNRIYGLVHDYYNSTDTFPADDKDGLAELPAELRTIIEAQPEGEARNQVWINCRGEYPADVENIKSIKYFPKTRGFPGEYFPYTKQAGYLSPLVAVQFEPKNVGQLLHLECRAFARNIVYSRRDRIGIVHLEIFLRP